MVVTERSEDSLIEAIDFLQSGTSEVREMQDQALKAVEMFSIENVSATFARQLAGCLTD